jgi:DnaJ-class molecular chaperone
MAEDLYQLLGVSRSATADEVKKAYRRLARKHHPDVNPGDKAAEDKFKKLSAAFEVLGDPKKRKLYDEFGEDAAKFGFDEAKAEQYRAYRAAASAPGGRGYARGGIPFDMGGEGVDIGDLFGELFGRASGGGRGVGFDPGEVFGRAGGRRAGPVPGDDLSARVGLSLAEALQGTERTLSVRRPRPDGSEESKQLTVKIPPGVQTGSKVRLAGQGTPGERGGPPGDLYIETEVAEHPLVRREGDDLHMDLPITVSEAMLGAEVRVPTFEGDVTVRVPAGSQSGKKMRLRGRGAPSLRGSSKGDLYLNLQVRVPEEADEAVRAAAEALARAYRGDVRAQVKL